MNHCLEAKFQNITAYRLTISLILAAIFSLAVTTTVLGEGKSIGKPSGVIPAVVEHIPDSEISRVTLTEKAVQRIDLQTDSVKEEIVGGIARKVVPYSSIIYDPNGGTWVYTSPQPRTFVRKPIIVDDIIGDRVVLKDGPSVGTSVATVGVAELYGTEFEVGH